MADESDILFVRSNSKPNMAAANDDVWDDTVLIKAYDRAVNLAKNKVAKRMGVEAQSTSHGKQGKTQNQKQNRHAAKPYKKWVVGSPCRAVWSEDGEVYEAQIQKIYENSGTCLVKFIGYDNMDKVEISSLAESLGLVAQIAQTKEANADKVSNFSIDLQESGSIGNPEVTHTGDEVEMECETEPRKFPQSSIAGGTLRGLSADMIPPAPPLPPQLMTRLPESDDDALSSMLMSWYISGFHTGYYHGIKQAKENQERRKK